MGDYAIVAAGLALLIFGAEALVRGGVAIARRLHVSPLLIGVTIIAYGTSAPELLVSVNASLHHSYGIAVGNVVGSNIFNILFILGLTALISPIKVSGRAIWRDGVFALIAAGVFVWFALKIPSLGWHEGVIMLGLLLGMIVVTYVQERASAPAADTPSELQRPLDHPAILDIGLILVGLGLLVLGADMLVDAAVNIARANGISEAVIGLTLIAAGTSLPELATSVVAALRRNPDIALGNVVGSNIYNVLAILGVASVLGPVNIDPEIRDLDMWVMLGATVALFLPAIFGNRMGRTYGLLLFASYLAYLAVLLQKAHVLHLPS